MVDLLFEWFGISCMTTDNFCFYFQNRLIQSSQTGGQWYSDTSPFDIPRHSALQYLVPHNGECRYAECHYAECHVFMVMSNDVMLSVIMLLRRGT